MDCDTLLEFEIRAADVEFLTPIGDLYGRNNRSNGQKNLRCFPVCSSVHSEIGFCGTPLPVNVKLLWWVLPVDVFTASLP
jgi:hypothetical protein